MLLEIREAEKYRILNVETDDDEPSLLLMKFIVYSDTEENQNFVRTLLRDAAAKGIIVFLMTRDQDWASKLID